MLGCGVLGVQALGFRVYLGFLVIAIEYLSGNFRLNALWDLAKTF